MFSLKTFEQKVKAANSGVRRKANNKRFWHKTTSLETLWSSIEQNRPAGKAIEAIKKIDSKKRKRVF